MSTTNFKVIQPAGTITATTSSQLFKQLDGALQASSQAILIDCQNVHFIDSSGLGMLVSMHTKVRLAGGRLYLCALNQQARCLLDITDMEQIFEIFPSKTEFYNSVVNQNQVVLAQ